MKQKHPLILDLTLKVQQLRRFQKKNDRWYKSNEASGEMKRRDAASQFLHK